MRKVIRGSLLLGCAISIGCAKPIMLKVDVMSPEPAAVTLRLIKGDKAAVPVECQTPCQVAVAPKTAHELSVRARGYYPASMEVTYEQLMLNIGAIGKKEAVLTVPLQRRAIDTAPRALAPK